MAHLSTANPNTGTAGDPSDASAPSSTHRRAYAAGTYVAHEESLLLILDESGDVVDEEAARLGGGEPSYIRGSVNAVPAEAVAALRMTESSEA